MSEPRGADVTDSVDVDPLVVTVGVTKRFRISKGIMSRVSAPNSDMGIVEAVSDLNIRIRPGEVLGLVGESGSGKSTTGLLLSLLERPTEGTVLFNGTDISSLRRSGDIKRFRREVQIVFQDPTDSLNPRYTVERTLTEPLRVHSIGGNAQERRAIVAQTLEMVELRPPSLFLGRFPHELSGGQKQRVATARAVILRPSFLVADEPISMLDVSVRIGLMNLLLDLRQELGLTYLFITHDLAAARYMCDRVVVMRHGKVVESGTAERILRHPEHEYTRELLASVPEPTEEKRVNP